MVGDRDGVVLMPYARSRLRSPRDEMLEATRAGQPSVAISFSGQGLILDASGAAIIESRRTLIVSDLHLEKGSAAAARGQPVPVHDSHDTLQRLKHVIDRYEPRTLISLGDSFHDTGASARMVLADKEALARLCASVPDWVWIGGNHDPQIPAFCGGRFLSEIALGGIVLRHQPVQVSRAPQIAGHYHPKTSVSAGRYRFSGRCFAVSDSLIVMPAFGAYTGGLPCSAPALSNLHRSDPQLYMIHAHKLWRVR